MESSSSKDRKTRMTISFLLATTPVAHLREERLLTSGSTSIYLETSRLEVRVMTNPRGGRQPRTGMSGDTANRDTLLISQLD